VPIVLRSEQNAGSRKVDPFSLGRHVLSLDPLEGANALNWAQWRELN
jgi:hypothetical protein